MFVFPCLQERFQHAEQGLAVGSEHRHARLHNPAVHAFEAAQAHAVYHGGRQPKGDDFWPRERQTLKEKARTSGVNFDQCDRTRATY